MIGGGALDTYYHISHVKARQMAGSRRQGGWGGVYCSLLRGLRAAHVPGVDQWLITMSRH